MEQHKLDFNKHELPSYTIDDILSTPNRPWRTYALIATLSTVVLSGCSAVASIDQAMQRKAAEIGGSTTPGQPTTPSKRPGITTTSPSPSFSVEPSTKTPTSTPTRSVDSSATPTPDSMHPSSSVSPDTNTSPGSTANTEGTRLITNEYRTYNPGSGAMSKLWKITSGSLYQKSDAGNVVNWTGVPDSCEDVGPDSTDCNNSNVFRAITNQLYPADFSMNIAVKPINKALDKSCTQNDSCWHGIHIFTGYESQYNTYYTSIVRPDGKVVIKRKVACGSDNNGTYVTLAEANHPFKDNAWNNFTITSQTGKDNQSVTITLKDADGTKILQGTDKGGTNAGWSPSCGAEGKSDSAQYVPITGKGAVGIRGDMTQFLFKDFVVKQEDGNSDNANTN